MKTVFSVRLFMLSVVTAVSMAVAPAFGAVDMFLKIPGITDSPTGEPGEVAVYSWSWGATNAGSAKTREAGSGLATGRRQHKPIMEPFTILKRIDKASPLLMKACVQGTHFPEVILRCVESTSEGDPYLKITLKEVMISSISSSGGGSEENQADTCSFDCSSITFEYSFKGSEPLTFTWDLKENKK